MAGLTFYGRLFAAAVCGGRDRGRGSPIAAARGAIGLGQSPSTHAPPAHLLVDSRGGEVDSPPLTMRLRILIALGALASCGDGPREEEATVAVTVTASHGTADDTTTAVGDDAEDVMADTSGGDSSGVGGTGPKLDVAAMDTGTGPTEISEVFGHSNNTLFRMDPDTKSVTEIGVFQGCSASIIDIALDADSQMYGTAYGSLWSIDRLTGQCTFIANGQYPTSLSFVPAGTVDPDEEAMVGFVNEEYIRIDVATGETTPLGTLSDGLRSSGDMVSVSGGGSWLTVVGPGCDAGDCIIEIDPADGTVLQNYGAMPYLEVFGLAFWAGRAYGFSNAGELFEIEFGDVNVATTLIDIPDAPGNLSFFGAGSTTSAPPAEG